MTFTATAHDFPGGVGNILGGMVRGDYFVYYIQHESTFKTVVGKHLGGGAMEWSAPVQVGGPTHQHQPQAFPYDDIVLFQSTGFEVHSYQILSDLSLVYVDTLSVPAGSNSTWPLINHNNGYVYFYTHDMSVGSEMRRASVSSSGVFGSMSSVSSDSSDLLGAENDPYPVLTDFWVNSGGYSLWSTGSFVTVNLTTGVIEQKDLQNTSALPGFDTTGVNSTLTVNYSNPPRYDYTNSVSALWYHFSSTSSNNRLFTIVRSGSAIEVEQTCAIGADLFDSMFLTDGKVIWGEWSTSTITHYDAFGADETYVENASVHLYFPGFGGGWISIGDQIYVWTQPTSIGQLHVNLSTDRENPNWVSVCPGNPYFVGSYMDTNSFSATWVDGWWETGGTSLDLSSAGAYWDGAPVGTTSDSVVSINIGGSGSGVLELMLRGANSVGDTWFVQKLINVSGAFSEAWTPDVSEQVSGSGTFSMAEFIDVLNSNTPGGGSPYVDIYVGLNSGTSVTVDHMLFTAGSGGGGGNYAGHFNTNSAGTTWTQVHLGNFYANTAISGSPAWYTCCSHGSSGGGGVPSGAADFVFGAATGTNTVKFGSGTDGGVLTDNDNATGWTLDGLTGEINGSFSGGPGAGANAGHTYVLSLTVSSVNPGTNYAYWEIRARDGSNVEYTMVGDQITSTSVETLQFTLSTAYSASFDPLEFADSLAAGTVLIFLYADNLMDFHEMALTYS